MRNFNTGAHECSYINPSDRHHIHFPSLFATLTQKSNHLPYTPIGQGTLHLFRCFAFFIGRDMSCSI